ncbi:hypothetical protein D3C80_1382910 [compost metagenome]
MARQHLRKLEDHLLEVIRRFGRMVAKAHLGKRHDVIPQFLAVQVGLVVLNQPQLLQALAPAPAGRDGHRQALAQGGAGQGAVLLQQAQQLAVYLVQFFVSKSFAH